MKKLLLAFTFIIFSLSNAFANENKPSISVVIQSSEKPTRTIIFKNIDIDQPVGQIFPDQEKKEGDDSHQIYFTHGLSYDYVQYSFGRLITMLGNDRAQTKIIESEDGDPVIEPCAQWNVFINGEFAKAGIDDLDAEGVTELKFVYTNKCN